MSLPPIATFVRERKPDWDALDALVGRARGTLDLPALERLDRLYRRASSDLATAQASFPGSDVERHLSDLVARAASSIYSARRGGWRELRAFYARGLPALVQRERTYVAVSAALLLLGAVLGAGVVGMEPRGAELLVPSAVRASLDAGVLWTDSLLTVAPESTSSAIATNNLSVSLSLFAGGLLLGLGPVALLAFNGAHLGAILTYAAQKEMLAPLLAFIAAHGPVELSVIVLAGASGLVLGHALMDPGEWTRSEALRRRGGEAVKLLLGVSPALAAIAVVEGYVSPGTLVPASVRAVLGLALATGLWAYLLGRSGAESDSTARARAWRFRSRSSSTAS